MIKGIFTTFKDGLFKHDLHKQCLSETKEEAIERWKTKKPLLAWDTWEEGKEIEQFIKEQEIHTITIFISDKCFFKNLYVGMELLVSPASTFTYPDIGYVITTMDNSGNIKFDYFSWRDSSRYKNIDYYFCMYINLYLFEVISIDTNSFAITIRPKI